MDKCPYCNKFLKDEINDELTNFDRESIIEIMKKEYRESFKIDYNFHQCGNFIILIHGEEDAPILYVIPEHEVEGIVYTIKEEYRNYKKMGKEVELIDIIESILFFYEINFIKYKISGEDEIIENI